MFLEIALAVLLFGLLFKTAMRFNSPVVEETHYQKNQKFKSTDVSSTSQKPEAPEPLVDFDFTTTPPITYRPFKTKTHLAMGIRKATIDDWIKIDKGYIDRLNERKGSMRDYPEVTIGSNEISNPAVAELYQWLMMDYLPTRFPTIFQRSGNEFYNKVTSCRYSLDIPNLSPATMLQNLGENIEEDFYFMCPDEDETLRLQGYIACFPGGFHSPTRVGQSMREIHMPVPGLDERIGKGTDKHLARIVPGTFIDRMNWSLQVDGPDLLRTDGNNFYPERGHQLPDEPGAVNIDTSYLRVECQTLLRLPKSRAVMFTVRTYLTSLKDIKDEGNGPLLVEAIESMPHKLGHYKKRPFWCDEVFKYLRG